MTGNWRTLQQSLALTLSVLALAVPASAADYYVSNGGNDGNLGTSTSPWRTLQKAANSVSAGDNVYVENGTYSGFQVTADGTASSPITFKANGASVIVNTRNSSTDDNINLEFADYIIIDGFVVEDAPRIGIRSVRNRGVIIRNNMVRRSGLTGILAGWTPEIQVLNNVSSGAIVEHGIYISNSDDPNDRCVVRGNEVFGNGKNGIQFNGDCWEGGDGVLTNCVIEDNFVHDNNWKGLSLISMDNSLVANNVIWDNGLSAGAGGIHFTDQVGPSCNKPSSNNICVNNTIVEPRIACIRMTDASTANVVFNNICVGSSSSYLIQDEVGGNLISSSNMQLTSSAGLFTNEAGQDFHLLSTANAVDGGEPAYQGQSAPTTDRDGNARPQGTGYDVGAYEYGQATGPDITNPTVNVISPGNGAYVSGTTNLTAAASDNIGVVGVQFTIDGANVGSEDTQSPYQVTLDSRTLSNTAHTVRAVARDAAGNTATSAGVTINVDNGISTGILDSHPRLALTPARLAELRADACYDDQGNVIPGCTPTDKFQIFEDWITLCQSDLGACYGEQAWNFALYYMITGKQEYADRCIAMVDADIADGLDAERRSFFLYARDHVRNAACAYDWLYDQLTPQKRTDYINYMNRIVQEIYVEDEYNNPFYNADRWATNDPGNNYYYSQLLSATLTAVATYGENPFTVPLNGQDVPLQLFFHMEGNAYQDILEFVHAKMENEAIARWIEVREVGGGWHEGDQYGTAAKNQIFKIWLYLRDAGDVDYFQGRNWGQACVRYLLHTIQPGGSRLYPGGDAGRDKFMPVSPYERHTMLLLARGLLGTPEGEYAQHWLTVDNPNLPSGWSFMKPWDFLWTNYRYPSRDYNEMDRAYASFGNGFSSSRSSWDSDAVCVSFLSSDRIQNHQHKDQNSFVIYHGGGTDGWQAIDANFCPGSNGLTKDSQVHNTILVNSEGQRYGDGTGELLVFDYSAEYAHSIGEAADAYYTNPGAYGSGDQKYLDSFQREVVHVYPGYVMVFDRVTPTSQFTGATITYQLQVQNSPTINGNEIVSTTSNGKLFHRTMVPSAVNISVNSNLCYTADIVPTTASNSTTFFMNAMYATDPGVTSMPQTLLVNSQTGNMMGAQIKDGAEEKVILFSSDPVGAPPQGNIIYEVGTIMDGRHFLFDLLPDTEYQVDVSEGEDGKRRVTVAQGPGGVYSNYAGTLVFDVRHEFEAPRVLAMH